MIRTVNGRVTWASTLVYVWLMISGGTLLYAQPIEPRAGKEAVTIEYIAHACFRITSPSGKKLLVDPYASRVWLGYDFPKNVEADAVLISHPHYDHDGGAAMRLPVPWSAKTVVSREPGTNRIGDMTVIGFAGKHADPWGKEFGQINTVWLVETAGIRIVHLGDNGPLTPDLVRQLGHVDVLMMPIDSEFHILKAGRSPTSGSNCRREFSYRCIIGMTILSQCPANLKNWAKNEPGVKFLNGSIQQISVQDLPKNAKVLIFKHSPTVKPPG